jgi:two-component system cell cycle sensor histidine kinase/response regulator CckA
MSGFRRTVLLNLAGVGASLVAARLGYLCAFPEQQAGFIWPPTGVAIALLLLWGPGLLPAVGISSIISNVAAGAQPGFSLLSAAGNMLQAAAAWWLLRAAGFDRHLTRTRDVTALVGLAAGLSTTIGATIGVGSLWLANLTPTALVPGTWARWWMANAMGVLLVLPALLTWAPRAVSGPVRTHRAEWIATLATVVIVASLVFLGLVGRYAQFALLFVTYPLLLWMGLRQPLRWTTLALTATATIAIAGTIGGLSPFSMPDLTLKLFVLWGYVGTIAVMTLLLSAAVSEARAEAESRSRLAAIVDATTDFVATATLEGASLSVNPAGRRLVGLAADASVGALQLLDFHPAWARALLLETGIPTAVRQGVWSGDTALLAEDGREIPVSQVVLAHRDERGGPAYISTIVRDMTERLRTEEALREREANLRLIFDVAPIGIVLIDSAGRFARANAAFQRIVGYDADELRGLTLFDITMPEDMAISHQAFDAFVSGGHDHVQIEKRYRRKDGSSVWARTYASAVRDEQGRFLHTVSLVDDITDRRRLEEELLQAQKMESIGRLAGGVAHDFNNLLTAILGYVDLADAVASDEAQVRECLAPVRSSAERAGQLTRQLLAFARKQMIEPRLVDLRELVDNVQQLLRRLLGEDIDVIIRGATDLWPVRVDPGQFEQVLLNLAVNGRDAMPNGGRIIIDSRNVEIGAADARPHADLTPGAYVVLSVSDDGMGMTDDVQKRVFDPFFTTKGPGLGTGLGLSMVHGTVKQHDGHITIDSAPNRGTTISIFLPRAFGKAVEPVEASSADVAPGGDETLLLVEDETLVREMAAASLRLAGYRVLAADSGDAALVAAGTHDGAIDLLLTDVVMPQMSGTELADRLLRIRPTIRVLYTSGYTQDLLVTRGVDGSSVAFLQKPYSPAALARHVRQVLDA